MDEKETDEVSEMKAAKAADRQRERLLHEFGAMLCKVKEQAGAFKAVGFAPLHQDGSLYCVTALLLLAQKLEDLMVATTTRLDRDLVAFGRQMGHPEATVRAMAEGPNP